MPKDRLSLEDIKDAVVAEQYYVFPGTTLTVACLTLRNGYVVTGESACVDPNNFNTEKGERYAYEAALSKIWQLEGYLLKEEHHKIACASISETVEILKA